MGMIPDPANRGSGIGMIPDCSLNGMTEPMPSCSLAGAYWHQRGPRVYVQRPLLVAPKQGADHVPCTVILIN
jgi:hypothetical protein